MANPAHSPPACARLHCSSQPHTCRTPSCPDRCKPWSAPAKVRAQYGAVRWRANSMNGWYAACGTDASFAHHSCISGHGAWRKGRAKCSMLVQGADRDLVKIWQKMHAKRFDNIVLKAKTVSAQATPDGMEATVPSSCCSTIHRKRKARARFLAAAWSANKGLRVSAMHAASIKPPLALHLAQQRRQWR